MNKRSDATLVDQSEPEAAPARPPAASRFAWGFVYCALVFGGWVALYGPGNIVWGKRFTTSYLGMTAGDHAQLTYYLWLWWHSLTTFSHLPWVDPFQFGATGHITHQPFGWPFVLVSIPVQALYGTVAAFNAVFYFSYIAAAGATYLWARALRLPPAAAAIAGFAFAFSPFRLAQRGHINAHISFLLPLCLYFLERALNGERRHARLMGWLCAATFASLTASGEIHVVVYFAPVLAAYALVRARGVSRERLKALAVPAGALVLASLAFLALTYEFTFADSSRAAARNLEEPRQYAARPVNLVKRSPPSERTLYPGAVTAALAVLGVFAARRAASRKGSGEDGPRGRDRRRLVTLLLWVIGVGYLLAMLPAPGGVGLRIYNAIPLVSRIRVPGRVMIVIMLAYALLAAIGIANIRFRSGVVQAAFCAVAAGLLLWDSSGMTRAIAAAPADPKLLVAVPEGAPVLDLPPFPAGHFAGSRYAFQVTYTPSPHVGGYSVFVTPEASSALNSVRPLVNVPPDPCRWRRVSRNVRFDYVVVHRALFGTSTHQWKGDGDTVVRALEAMPGFRRVGTARDVVVLRFDRSRLRCAQP